MPFTTVFLASAATLLAIAAAILAIDAARAARTAQPIAFRWRPAGRFAAAAALCLIPALSIVVVRLGISEVRHHTVAEILGDTAAESLYGFRGGPMICGHRRLPFFRIEPRRKRG